MKSQSKIKNGYLSGPKRDMLLGRAGARLADMAISLVLLEVLPGFLGFLVGFAYILLSDGFSRGRSVGKGLIGLRVVKTGGKLSGQVMNDDAADIEYHNECNDADMGSDQHYNDNIVGSNEVDTAIAIAIADRDADGGFCDYRLSIFRNLSIAFALLLYNMFNSLFLFLLVLGFECLLILGNRHNRRLGDMLADTIVVIDNR